MTVEGVGAWIRNPEGSGSGCLNSVDHLYWLNSDAVFPGVPVEADETLIILAWFNPTGGDDFYARILVDGDPVGSTIAVSKVEAELAHWPAAWTASVAGLSVGTHTVAIEFVDPGSQPDGGGIEVLHFANSCYRVQANIGT